MASMASTAAKAPKRCIIRQTFIDRGASQTFTVLDTLSANGGINDQLYFFIFDIIQNVRAAFNHLVDT